METVWIVSVCAKQLWCTNIAWTAASIVKKKLDDDSLFSKHCTRYFYLSDCWAWISGVKDNLTFALFAVGILTKAQRTQSRSPLQDPAHNRWKGKVTGSNLKQALFETKHQHETWH